ncbi:ABC transporter family substrate-binding protein [Nonomuraea sp. NPDC050310]|uniref:ABC transporter family substrate-binding protein n=1 Tax=unclassified Nonomuraea TaxID=2593643 RepID=UPI0033E5FB22
MKVRITAVAGVAALALGLTACGGGGTTQGGGQASTPAGQPASSPAASDGAIKELPPQDINEQPREKVKDGGTLRLAINNLGPQFNRLHANGGLADTDNLADVLLPQAFDSDGSGNLKPNKDLLVSAEQTSTSPQTIVYKINPAAKWSDGKPITAKDFIAQANAMSGKDKKFQAGFTTGYDQIESIKQGADEREVIMIFKAPFQAWQGLFGPLMSAEDTGTPDAFNKNWLNKVGVTGGPFKLDKIDQTAKTFTVVRDDNFWGDKAKLDSIVFRTLAVDAETGAFANGEIDFTDIGPDAAALKQAEAVPGAVIRRAAGPDIRHITLNAGGSEILKDQKVRQAVFMGLNREAITESDLNGLGVPVKTLDNLIYVNTQPAYKPNAGEFGTYNPDKAKALLEEAGWKLEGATRKKDGKELVLRYVIGAGVPITKAEAELAQAMLGEIGIKVNIEQVPLEKFWDDYVYAANFDLCSFSLLGTPFPISDTVSSYKKPEIKDGKPVYVNNTTHFGTDEIDQMLATAASELDPAKAAELANAADVKLWEQALRMTLFQRPQIKAAKANLANLGAPGFADSSEVWENVGFTE